MFNGKTIKDFKCIRNLSSEITEINIKFTDGTELNIDQDLDLFFKDESERFTFVHPSNIK